MTTRPILAAVLFSLACSAQAAGLCQQKEQAIQHEIEIARQHDNPRRVSGLERALTETRANCSDASVRAAHQQKIKEHQQKVVEREQELKQEQAEGGDRQKIAKREKKLAEAQRELKDVQAAPY